MNRASLGPATLDMSAVRDFFAEVGKFEKFLPGDLSIGPGEGTGRSAVIPFVKANLEHLFPSLQGSRLDDLVRDIFWHQGLASVIEPKYPHLLDAISVRDSGEAILRAALGEPAIFCSFHYGSYRLVAGVLWNAGIPFDLVVSSEVAAIQSELFQKQIWAGEKRFGKRKEFKITVADDPRSLVGSLRSLTRGRSLLFYIDGNMGNGSGGGREDRFVKVPFLGGSILARRGVAFISQRSGVPIVPVLATRAHGWIPTVDAFPAVLPNERNSIDEQAAITRGLYKLLESQLLLDPTQWEGWLYVHRFFSTIPEVPTKGAQISSSAPLEFNSSTYDLVFSRGVPLLLHKPDYRLMPLEPRLYEILRNINGRKVEIKELFKFGLSLDAINALTERGVLAEVVDCAN